MSHYAVAVFSNDGDFDSLLAPYNEHDPNYYVFEPIPYGKIVERFERFKEHNPRWTLEKYIKEFKLFQKDGEWGYEHNPRGYWNYYSLDGKDYLFDLKKGAKCEEGGPGYYRKNDYNWYPDDKEAREDAREFWDDFIGPDALAEPPGPWSKQYFLDRYKTKEQYIKEASRTIPYAFITPDGVWHAPGRVWYFAMSDESADDSDRYAAEWDTWLESDANPYVSIVDCHI